MDVCNECATWSLGLGSTGGFELIRFIDPTGGPTQH